MQQHIHYATICWKHTVLYSINLRTDVCRTNSSNTSSFSILSSFGTSRCIASRDSFQSECLADSFRSSVYTVHIVQYSSVHPQLLYSCADQCARRRPALTSTIGYCAALSPLCSSSTSADLETTRAAALEFYGRNQIRVHTTPIVKLAVQEVQYSILMRCPVSVWDTPPNSTLITI